MRTAIGVSGFAVKPLAVGAVTTVGAALPVAVDVVGAGAVGAPAGAQAALSRPVRRLPMARAAVSWRSRLPGCIERCTRCLLVGGWGGLTPQPPLPRGEGEPVALRTGVPG